MDVQIETEQKKFSIRFHNDGISLAGNEQLNNIKLDKKISNLFNSTADELNSNFDEILKIVSDASSEIIIESPFFVLVPSVLYLKEKENLLFKFQSEALPEHWLILQKDFDADNLILFAIPPTLKTLLDTHFQESEISHHLQKIYRQNFGAENSRLLVWERNSDVDVLVLKKHKISLYNTFHTPSQEDLMYYLLKICEELEITSDRILLKLYQDENSFHHPLLKKHFVQVQFIHKTLDQ